MGVLKNTTTVASSPGRYCTGIIHHSAGALVSGSGGGICFGERLACKTLSSFCLIRGSDYCTVVRSLTAAIMACYCTNHTISTTSSISVAPADILGSFSWTAVS